MHTLKQSLLLRCLKSLNCLLMTAAFALCYFRFYCGGIAAAGEMSRLLGSCLVFLVLYCIFGKIYDAYLISMARVSEMIYSQALALLVADGFLYVILCMMYTRFLSLIPMMLLFAIQLVISFLWSYLSNKWYYGFFPPRRCIVVYDQREGFEKLIDSYSMTRKYDVRKVITTKECLADLSVLDDMETVFLSGVHSADRNRILKQCMYNHTEAYVIPRVGDVIMSGAQSLHMFHLPIMKVTSYNPSPFYLFFKRAFDILVASVAMLVLSPVFLITAIAVKSDGGPAFYKQERLTKDGKKFYIHKFRSMIVDAEKDGKARLSTGDKDDRITPVGHIIRKVRIDELPQLLDIIRGDLSVVGPRPEREEIALQYEEEIPEFRLRLQAKAGLTGYAQVYGKYNSTPYDKLQMDLMYIAHPSFIEDLKICFATVKILFMPESTDGVEEGAVTALGVSKDANED